VAADFTSNARRLLLLIMVCAAPGHAQIVLSQGTNLAADVSSVDGRLAMDLLGSIWIVPADGGTAEMLSDNLLPAMRPRWSPDGKRILYQTQSAGQSQIWSVGLDGADSIRLSDGKYFDQHPQWHPDGERIVFSSARGASGFDIWETDLPTGLSWRISSQMGDETEPAWSADGSSLLYIHRDENQWSLILRRNGQPERVLVASADPLSAPSWRPDGSLVTFLRKRDGELDVEMAILADPPLIRPWLAGEDFFVSPLSWRDRMQLFYTSDGVIKTRGFDDWESTPLAFSATVGQPAARSERIPPKKKALQPANPPNSRIVIRAARLFDGTGGGYRRDIDVLIDGARIASIANRQEWPDATVLNLGNVTVLPGFIDSYSSVPLTNQKSHGAELLSYGVTTLITTDHWPDYDPMLWEGEETPGPRLLWAGDIAQTTSDDDRQFQFVTIPSSGLTDADRRSAVSEWQAKGVPVLAESWSIGLGVGADLLLGVDSLPTSPKGIHYQDIRAATAAAPIALVSGLADAGTPGLSTLLRSRQAKLLRGKVSVLRRFSSIPDFSRGAPSIMLGSKPSGLPPGLALHAEMRALAAAGLSGEQVLMAASGIPASVLGLDGQIGRIAEGAIADLVLVSGDPLARVADAMNIVAVVRNGRFYSLVSLLERASEASAVE
jgi:hypothetical protein